MKIFNLNIALFILSFNLFAQVTEPSDLMFKKEITRAIDLREKQNEPFFSTQREISKLLIDAALAGNITPYSSDSLSKGKALTVKELKKRITIETDELEEDTAFMDDYDKALYLEQLSNGEYETDYFFGKDLYQMEMIETLYFSRKTSEMRHHIKTLTIFLPAEHPNNIRGIQQPIATFDFQELISTLKNNPQAIWYNPKNDAEHLSLISAFELRLFSSYIIKISNPNDEYLVDIYNGNQEKGIMQSSKEEYKLLQIESNFWEN